MSVFWERLAGTQPVPPVWTVAASAVAALLVVLNPRAWHLTRNAITIAHEGGHALISVLSGRRLEGIRLHSDTSGETVSRGRRTGPGMVLTAFAGYVTPPLLGAGAAALLAAHHVTLLLWVLLLLVAVTAVAMRNAFGVLAVFVTAVAISAVTWAGSASVQAVFGYGAAWFLLFGGVRPIVELARTRARRGRDLRGRPRRGRWQASDADQLARLTGVPGGVWVCVFALVAVAAVVLGARLLIPGSAHLPHLQLR
jgi:peptidase M50B-like protein